MKKFAMAVMMLASVWFVPGCEQPKPKTEAPKTEAPKTEAAPAAPAAAEKPAEKPAEKK